MWVLSVEFPANFTSFISSLGFINLDFVEALPLDCYMENNYIRQLVVMTCTPIILSLLLFMASKIYECVKPDHKDAIHTHYFSFFLVLTFLVFPSVSGKIFRTFSCDELDNGKSYLRADYSIDCDSNEYSFGIYWAILMIFIYPVGIPLLYFCLLYSKRNELNPDIDEKVEAEELEALKLEMREENDSLASISFLFDAYEPQLWWWEVLECVRRLLLTGMMVFFLEGTAVQIVIGIMIALASVKVYGFYLPFIDDGDDVLAEVAQWQTFLVLFGALLIRVDVTSDDEDQQDSYGALFIFITIIGPIVGLVITVYERIVTIVSHLDDHQEILKENEDDGEESVRQPSTTEEYTPSTQNKMKKSGNKVFSEVSLLSLSNGQGENQESIML